MSYSFRHSDNKAQLKFGVDQCVLNKRKSLIYSVSFKNSLSNLFTKKESYRLMIDVIRIACVRLDSALSLIKSIRKMDVDKMKETYRYMIYNYVW